MARVIEKAYCTVSAPAQASYEVAYLTPNISLTKVPFRNYLKSKLPQRTTNKFDVLVRVCKRTHPWRIILVAYEQRNALLS